MTASAPGSASPHRLLVAAAVLFVLVVVGVGAVQLMSEFVQRSFERTSALVPEGPRLTVEARPGGTIVVAPSDDGRVHVVARGQYGLSEPDLIEESTAAGVLLAATCSGWPLDHCDVDYELQVPPELALALSTPSGVASVRDMAGPVHIEVDSGAIAVSRLAGPVHLQASSGQIVGAELESTTISGETGSGNIRLSAVAAPQSLTVETGSGDVDITVPGSATYRVDVGTGTGQELVMVPHDPAAQRFVRVHTGTGDVAVRAS